MEDNIETILFNKSTKYLFSDGTNSRMPWIAAGVTSGVYAVWSMFVLPGFRKIPWKLKVPYLPSGKTQTANVLKLLQGRKGQLADLGSGDGRLYLKRAAKIAQLTRKTRVFEAASLGFKSTGYEIHPILVNWAKATALWRGLPEDKAAFLKENFWTADLSTYNNVIVFLSPSVVDTLKKKLSAELPDDARVIVCRFPLSGWHPTFSEGHGLDQVWAYDMAKIKKNSSQDGNQQLL